MTDDEQERLLKIVKDATTRLHEHFSTVQIFVTRDPVEIGDSAGLTHSLRYGAGNWFARYGQIVDFIEDQKAGNVAGALKD